MAGSDGVWGNPVARGVLAPAVLVRIQVPQLKDLQAGQEDPRPGICRVPRYTGRYHMRKRLLAAAATPAVLAGSLLGLAGTASAQNLPSVSASISCGPVTSTVSASVSGGTADASASESVSVAGLNLSVPFTLDATGSGLGALQLPTIVLETMPQLPVTVTVSGVPTTVNVPVNCGGIL